MLVSGIAFGIAAAAAFGGDWRRLANLQLRWWPLLVVAAAIRLWTSLDANVSVVIWTCGLVGVAVVALRNAALPGAILIGLGTAANVAVSVLNQGMPYDRDALLGLGGHLATDAYHVPLTPETSLAPLADVIPIAIARSVFSPGDLIIAFGGFLVPFVLMQPRSDASARSMRSPNFAFFWLSQTTSRFGDPITLVTLAYVAYRATGSALATAVAIGVATVPIAFFSFVGGAVADGVGARRAMYWCDVIRALAVGSIPLLLFAQAPLAVVLVPVLLSGLCSSIFGPARGALVRSLVPSDQWPASNSLLHASDRTIEIVGAVAAGVLVISLGEGAFYVDALTFAFSAAFIGRVVTDDEAAVRITWPRLRRDAVEGVRFLRNSTVLWANTKFSLAAQLFNPVVNTLTPALLIRRYAGGDPTLGAGMYAGSEAAIAAGAVLSSVFVGRYVRRFGKGRAMLVGFVSSGLVVIALAFAPTYGTSLALFGLLGVTNVMSFVPNVTISQEHTPQGMIGRVYGARIALLNSSWLPVIFLGGFVADAIGVELLFAAGGAVAVAAALTGAFVPAIRDVP